MSGHLIVWEFVVKPGREAEFERHYDARGSWAQLFSRAPGYGGTRLLHDLSNPRRYLTVDRWADAESFHAFRERHGAEYESLDRTCDGLTEREVPLGEFAEPGPA